MADEFEERLEAHAARPTAPIDPTFADRLESRLRHQHAQQTPVRRRAASLLPRLALGALLIIAGIAGVVALTGRDAGVPLEVVEGEPVAPAAAPETGGEDPAPAVADATTTPTTTPAVPVATVVPNEEPTAATSAAAQSEATVTAAPEATATSIVVPPTSTATSEPTTTPTATVVPVVPAPTLTPTPVPTPSVTPAPATPIPLPTATAQPEPTPEPLVLPLICELRRAGDQVGVSCEWPAPDVDIVQEYTVLRSRNGSDAQVVSRQRAAAPTVFVDRDIARGDELIYLVRAFNADGGLVAASVRQVVTVPGDS